MSDNTYIYLLNCLIDCIKDILKLCIFSVSGNQGHNSKFEENKSALMGKRVGEGIGY